MNKSIIIIYLIAITFPQYCKASEIIMSKNYIRTESKKNNKGFFDISSWSDEKIEELRSLAIMINQSRNNKRSKVNYNNSRRLGTHNHKKNSKKGKKSQYSESIESEIILSGKDNENSETSEDSKNSKESWKSRVCDTFEYSKKGSKKSSKKESFYSYSDIAMENTDDSDDIDEMYDNLSDWCFEDDDSNYCPNPDSDILACAPRNLPEICNKYDEGSFETCYDACKSSYCCIHDSKSQVNFPSCSEEPNCSQYRFCYIIWFKLADRIGPQNYLLIDQDDDFYDLNTADVIADLDKDINFNYQLFGHFRDDDNDVPAGWFENPENW